MGGERQSRKRVRSELLINGHFIERNAGLYMVLMGLIAAFELFFFISGVRKRPSVARNIYLTSYVLLFSASISMIPFLVMAKMKRIKKEVLGVIPNVFAFFILIWSILISSMDMRNGKYPIVYLTIAFTVGALVMINPFPYILSVITSLLALLSIDKYFGYGCFTSPGDYFNLVVFSAMSFLVSYRQHSLLLQENASKEQLRKSAVTDFLTGLGNETLYFTEIDAIDRFIEKKRMKPFAVAVMDVNNVKATNDANGHRFGCRLIEMAGKTLPSVFPTSRLFHIGGDEFIAILEKEDLIHLEESMARFKDALYDSEITFEGKTLHLSVAIGVAVYKSGMHYKDVFQRADDEMYVNKVIMKKELGLAAR
ncbi:MAG: GGDEF domain-containing protein [Spirochaetales bacterium]|nr:GGDEF domain-containing protein [Candidatus Physcosoma equi]